MRLKKCSERVRGKDDGTHTHTHMHTQEKNRISPNQQVLAYADIRSPFAFLLLLKGGEKESLSPLLPFFFSLRELSGHWSPSRTLSVYVPCMHFVSIVSTLAYLSGTTLWSKRIEREREPGCRAVHVSMVYPLITHQAPLHLTVSWLYTRSAGVCRHTYTSMRRDAKFCCLHFSSLI